jgi:hypothetical protein
MVARKERMSIGMWRTRADVSHFGTLIESGHDVSEENSKYEVGITWMIAN